MCRGPQVRGHMGGPSSSCHAILLILSSRTSAGALPGPQRARASPRQPQHSLEQALAGLRGGRTACKGAIDSHKSTAAAPAGSRSSSQATLCAARRAAPGAAGRSGQRSPRSSSVRRSAGRALRAGRGVTRLAPLPPGSPSLLQQCVACLMLLVEPLWLSSSKILAAAFQSNHLQAA